MFRRSLLFVISVCTFCVSFAVTIIGAPLKYLLKTNVAHSVFNILSAIKLIAFRIIEQLKPIYRLSFLTDGRSLKHRRCFA